MNPAETLEHIRDVVTADAVLLAWCTATFGDAPTVYIGAVEDDGEARFPQTEYPVVVIKEVRQVTGDAFPGIAFHVPVAGHVFEGGFDVSNRTYTGILHAANLIEQVADAVIRARFSKVTTEKQINGAGQYPFFYGTCLLYLERITIKRR